jgi:hypothetical protein
MQGRGGIQRLRTRLDEGEKSLSAFQAFFQEHSMLEKQYVAGLKELLKKCGASHPDP